MKRLVLLVVLALAGVASAEPTRREHEVLTQRPSGFWTSNRPAVGGAYRWRLLGIGVALAATMGLVTVRILRRANGERARR